MPRKNPTVGTKRQKSIVLSDKQAKFVDATLEGKDAITAARAAGFSQPVGSAHRVVNAANVKAALSEARSELSSAVQITRADVIAGITEGIDLARLAADPATMIKGWSEIGKILGHYAPEVKKVEMSLGARAAQSKLTAMSDDELLEMISGRRTIDITPEDSDVA